MAEITLWYFQCTRGISKETVGSLRGLDGLICVAEDILIFGDRETYAEAIKDHDRRLIALMERCALKNIKLNSEKYRFQVKEVNIKVVSKQIYLKINNHDL